MVNWPLCLIIDAWQVSWSTPWADLINRPPYMAVATTRLSGSFWWPCAAPSAKSRWRRKIMLLELHRCNWCRSTCKRRQCVAVTWFVDLVKALKATEKVTEDSQLWNGSPYYRSFNQWRQLIYNCLNLKHHRGAPWWVTSSTPVHTAPHATSTTCSLHTDQFFFLQYESCDASPVYRTSDMSATLHLFIYNSYDQYGPPVFQTSYDDYLPLYEHDS